MMILNVIFHNCTIEPYRYVQHNRELYADCISGKDLTTIKVSGFLQSKQHVGIQPSPAGSNSDTIVLLLASLAAYDKYYRER